LFLFQRNSTVETAEKISPQQVRFQPERDPAGPWRFRIIEMAKPQASPQKARKNWTKSGYSAL
jgi:hypothetical protein